MFQCNKNSFFSIKLKVIKYGNENLSYICLDCSRQKQHIVLCCIAHYRCVCLFFLATFVFFFLVKQCVIDALLHIVFTVWHGFFLLYVLRSSFCFYNLVSCLFLSFSVTLNSKCVLGDCANTIFTFCIECDEDNDSPSFGFFMRNFRCLLCLILLHLCFKGHCVPVLLQKFAKHSHKTNFTWY